MAVLLWFWLALQGLNYALALNRMLWYTTLSAKVISGGPTCLIQPSFVQKYLQRYVYLQYNLFLKTGKCRLAMLHFKKFIHSSIHPLCRLSGLGLWGQQSKRRLPDLTLLGYFLQVIHKTALLESKVSKVKICHFAEISVQWINIAAAYV